MFSKFKYHILIFLSSVLVLAGLAINYIEKPNFLGVYFYDVGEGDSILIETPVQYQILIDGGPTDAVVQKIGRTLPFYDRKIELIILTHPDSDHLRGLIEVLRRYDTDMILTSNIKCETSICREWRRIIEEKKIPVKIAFPEEVISLGENLTMRVLYAFDIAQSNSDNSGSLVLRLDYGNDSFLFTGDIEENTEEFLETSGAALAADVLKVAHHGSKTSTTQKFLEAVNPRIAVISAGKNNRYGHPADEILARLETFSSEILRTDQMGDIRIFSNGEKLIIR